MSEQTKISWTDSTFNPWWGCEPVSPGCANCYAAKWAKRFGKDFSKRQRTGPNNWRELLRWNKKPWICDDCLDPYKTPNDCHLCKANGSLPTYHRRRVFCGSMCDIFDDKADIRDLADALDLMRQTPNLLWMLLTKRPELFFERLHAARKCFMPASQQSFWITNWIAFKAEAKTYPANVFLGTTAENQEQADKRIPELLKIPAAGYFLSCEPLLGPVTIPEQYLMSCRDCGNNGSAAFDNVPGRDARLCLDACQKRGNRKSIDLVIIGGESGPNARPCNVEWIRSLVRQCDAAGVSPFVKQLGRFCIRHEGSQRIRILNDDRDGRDPSEWPEDLRRQEIPERMKL